MQAHTKVVFRFSFRILDFSSWYLKLLNLQIGLKEEIMSSSKIIRDVPAIIKKIIVTEFSLCETLIPPSLL